MESRISAVRYLPPNLRGAKERCSANILVPKKQGLLFLILLQYDNLLSQFGCMQVSSSASSQSLSTPELCPLQVLGNNIEQYIHGLDNNSFELDLQFSEEEKRLLLAKQAGGNPW